MDKNLVFLVVTFFEFSFVYLAGLVVNAASSGATSLT